MFMIVVLHGITGESGTLATPLLGTDPHGLDDVMTRMLRSSPSQEGMHTLEALLGTQVWYDRHSEVDHSDLEKEVQAAADKGEFYGNWHISGMQHVNR